MVLPLRHRFPFSTPSYLTKPCYTATTCWTSANSRAIYAEQSDSRWCIFTRQSPHFALQLGSTPPKNFESLVRIMSSRRRPQVHTRSTWPGCPQIRRGAPRAGLHDDAHHEQDPCSQRSKTITLWASRNEFELTSEHHGRPPSTFVTSRPRVTWLRIEDSIPGDSTGSSRWIIASGGTYNCT